MGKRGELMSVKVFSVNREISGGPQTLLSFLIKWTLLCLLLVTSELTSGLYCSTMDVDSYLLYICFCSKSDAIIKTAFFACMSGPSICPSGQQSDSRSIGCVRDWPVALDQGQGVSSPDTVPVVWIDGVIVVAIMCLLLKTVTHTDAHTDRDAVHRHRIAVRAGSLSAMSAVQQLSHTLWVSVLFPHTLKNVNIHCYFWYHLKIIVNAKGLTFRWLLNKDRYSIINHLVTNILIINWFELGVL